MSQNKATQALIEVITFNDILSPLMLAIAAHMGIVNSKESCDVEALLLAKLVENVMNTTNKHIKDMQIKSDLGKWVVASNISRLVAANYKNTKDVFAYDIENVDLQEQEEVVSFSSEEDFKEAVFEAMSPIVNVVKRFNFALEEENIISGAEKQITLYATNLFEAVDRKSLGKEYFNHLYLKTIKNLSDLFGSCYYSEIDATLSIPKESREPFIQRHMIDSSDSVEKMLDCFYSRSSMMSNISVSLNVPMEKMKS